jgi:enolase
LAHYKTKPTPSKKAIQSSIPKINHFQEAISLCCDAIEKAGYTGKIKIGMDVAASEFYKDGKYDLDFKNPKSNPEDWISSEKLGEMYKGFIKDAPVISIEDPFDQVRFSPSLVLPSFYNFFLLGSNASYISVTCCI